MERFYLRRVKGGGGGWLRGRYLDGREKSVNMWGFGCVALCCVVPMKGLGVLGREGEVDRNIPAARIITSEIPLFSVFVAVKTRNQYPVFVYLYPLLQRKTKTPLSLPKKIKSASNSKERTFIRALAQLSIMRGLLYEVEDGLREGLVGDRPGCLGVVSLG